MSCCSNTAVQSGGANDERSVLDDADMVGTDPADRFRVRARLSPPRHTSACDVADFGGAPFSPDQLHHVVVSGLINASGLFLFEYVDGVFTGRGPLRRIPVAPGDHEVSIRAEGKERTGTVSVQLNKNTRAVFKGE